MSEAEAIQKVLSQQKVRQWDIYIQKVKEHEIQLRNFDVEIIRGPITNFGYAVRVVKRKKSKVGIGIGTGSSLQPQAIKKCIHTASTGATVTEFPGYSMPKPSKYPNVKIADSKIVSNPQGIVEDKVEELISLLGKSRTVLPTFGKIRTYEFRIVLTNSEGVFGKKAETLFYVELALKAERGGKLAEYWPMHLVRRAEDINFALQVPKWVKLTEDTLDARVPKTAKTTVILTPQVLSDIFPDTIGFHCSGSSLYKRISRFKKGEKVGSAELNIYDDGLYDNALGSSPFDDEGTPQSRKSLIEKGIHRGYLYDAMYAAVMKNNSTGNSQKLPPSGLALAFADVKYSLMPSIHPTNTLVEPGDMDLEEMIATTKTGVYVEQFSSMDANSLTTSFGSEIRNGYLIERGELSTPVKGGQIGGFVLDMQVGKDKTIPGILNMVSGMTKELHVARRCVAPYMRFEGIQVSGK